MDNSAESATPGQLTSQSNIKSEHDYFEEAIVFNEYPFRIEGDKLKEKLHRSVGALTFLNKNKKINAGSAALISKDVILTCAHNLYDKYSDSQNSDFKFYIGANGVAQEYYEIEAWRFPQEFKACLQSNKLEFDYGVIKLKRSVILDEYLPLSPVCQECTVRDNQSTKVMVYGFPLYKQNFMALDEEGNKLKLYQYGLTRKNRIINIEVLNFKMKYSISTLPGQSGCPVAIDNRIVAVHVGGDMAESNLGRIVDASLLKNLTKWVKQLNATPFDLIKNECKHLKIAQQLMQNKNGEKINAILLFNDFCKDIEQQRTQKFQESNYKYYSQQTIKDFIEKVTPLARKYIEQKFRYSKISKNSSMRIWLLKKDIQKGVLFNSIRQGCRANNTFEYKLYLQAELLQGGKSLNDYDITSQSQFVFQFREENQKNWMFFNYQAPLQEACTNCKSIKTLNVLCSCKYAAYCSQSCRGKDQLAHKNRCPNDAKPDKQQQKKSNALEKKKPISTVAQMAQINAILLFNDFCKDIEQQRTQKFQESNYKYYSQQTIKDFIEKVTPLARKYIEQKFRYSKISKNSSMRIWLLKKDIQKGVLFNSIRQGCRANNTFEYKLYLQAELLQGGKSLNDYDITSQSQFVFQFREENQKNWMFFNYQAPLQEACTNCKSIKTLNVLCSCKYAAYCSQSCRGKDQLAHKNRCPNDAKPDKQQQKKSNALEKKKPISTVAQMAQINAILLFNDFCKDIEQQRTQKFQESNYKYYSQQTIKDFIEKVTPLARKYIEQKFRYSKISKNSSMRIWLLKKDIQKGVLFNSIRQGCRANNTFEYKLYLQAELLQGGKSLNDYDITSQSQFVFQFREENQKNWMFFNYQAPLQEACTNCKSIKTLNVLCSCKYAAYCSQSCRGKDQLAHKNRCPNDAKPDKKTL